MKDLTNETIESTVFFDTNDYLEEGDDYDFMEDDFEYMLELRTNKVRGQVSGYALLSTRSSRYGSISNHGQTGFKVVKNQDNLARAILRTEADRVTAEEVDGELVVSYYDHDGVDTAVVKSVSKSKEDRFSNVIDYSGFEKALEYIEELPSIKIKAKYYN